MRIMVTGATGLIGRNLCAELAEHGHTVLALIRPGSQGESLYHKNIERVTGDVTVVQAIASHFDGVDCVIHAAGVKSAARPQTLTQVNVHGTQQLADMCHAHGVRRFVYMSSISAQGPSRPGKPHIQPQNEAPVDPYGHSKLAAEKCLMEHPIRDRLTIFRPGVVYGPGERTLVPWIKAVQLGVVPVISDLEFSFLHLRDLVRITRQVVDRHNVTGPYFLAHGQPIRMAKVVDLIEKHLGCTPAVRLFTTRRKLAIASSPLRTLSSKLGLAPGLVKLMSDLGAESWGCIPQLARDELGFEPDGTFDTGLGEVIRWCQEGPGFQ